MRFVDLLKMSASSLFKRKFRTVLTILGVVIGVASIVVMVSLGLGLQKATLDDIQNYSSLTAVTVNQPYNDAGVKEKDKKFLSDSLMEEFMSIPHVISVDPYLNLDTEVKYGSYAGYITIQGMPIRAMEEAGINVGEGHLPTADAGRVELFIGNKVLMNRFYNSKTYQGYYETGKLPDLDFMKDTVFYTVNATPPSTGNNNQGEAASQLKPKKFLFPVCGMEGGTEDVWTRFSDSVLCDIEQLKPFLKKNFKNLVIPGQPTTSKGKPYKELYYSQLIVNVDDFENVQEVTKIITDMGYSAYSDAEWIESMQKQMGTMQAVLGGIGAVSLFVAAIGITNTMMMSIYERTKEIGIMKVLGCDMRNIGSMFLMEAGFIGFFGGIFGLMLSFGISGVINFLVSQGGDGGMLGGGAGGISYIPLWLCLLSMVFAILVGMVAGFFPARRAMRLSPLAAIHNE